MLVEQYSSCAPGFDQHACSELAACPPVKAVAGGALQSLALCLKARIHSLITCLRQVFTSTPAVSLRHAHSSAVAGGAGAGQRRGLVLPAEAEPAPEIYVDSVGAVSIVTDTDLAPMPGVFRNVDGHRNEDGRYAAFTEEITGFIPRERQFTDPVRTFAYGTDASFYRLNPRMVVKARPTDCGGLKLMHNVCQ